VIIVARGPGAPAAPAKAAIVSVIESAPSRGGVVLGRGLLLVVAGTAVPAFAGSVTGRVQLIEKGGARASDLSDVVVYVEGAKARLPVAKASITMKGKNFIPRVTVVPVGATVEFPNQDPIFHNVFSVSGDNRFDLSLYKRPNSKTQVFQHPGVVRIYCNIHPQMSAVILVRDNPFFARATPDGTFSIDSVPPGKYLLKAWHERASELFEEITVPTDSRPCTVQFVLDASSFKAGPHKNKYGKDYSSNEKY